MNRVLALVEGRTEQSFIQQVLAPHLGSRGVGLSATLIGKPGHKGGVRRYAKIQRDFLAALKQDQDRYCTTMFDYYGLPGDWPGASEAKESPAGEAASHIERSLLESIREAMGASFQADRFVPYVQMHEFEALLFSDCDILAEVIGQPGAADDLRTIVEECGEPEQIDDGHESAPSKRIVRLAPTYQKVLHGTIAAKRIGLTVIRKRCPHFDQWLQRLEALGPP